MKKPPFITPTCGHPSHREPLRIGEINYTAQQINELLSLIPDKADKKEVFPNDSYLGHFPMGAQLPDMDRFAWAFVGDLNKAHPYFYYPKSTVPQDYQPGWNDMAKEFGTYLLTPGKQDQLTAEELFKEKFRLPQLTADRAIADEHGNRITDTYVKREAVANHIKQIYNQQFLDNPPLITEGYITPEMLSEETKQMLEATGQEITNLPDGEDLQSVHGVLKLADKQYNPNAYSGLGRRILRKNIIAGVNVLTQTMMQWPNTIYVIQYDYDLQGETITVPENCVLDFQGGSLNNGTIVGNNTGIKTSVNQIFTNILIKGNWPISNIYSNWFDFKEGEVDNITNFRNIMTMAESPILSHVYIQEGEWYTSCHTVDETGEYLNNRGISIPSNVYIHNNATIRQLPNKYEKTSMFHIQLSENVTIDGGKLIGDVKSHTGESGEWNHGIYPVGAKNLIIKNIEISEFWGDGIDIQSLYDDYENKVSQNHCKNVIITNVKCLNNRRQGLSIEAVDGLLVEDSEFSGTGSIKYTAPGAGIDIEPWHDYQIIRNITIQNCRLFDNYTRMLIHLRSIFNQEHNIQIKNCESDQGLFIKNVNGLFVDSFITKGESSYLALWDKGENITILNSVFNNEVYFKGNYRNVLIDKCTFDMASPAWAGFGLTFENEEPQSYKNIVFSNCNIDTKNKSRIFYVNSKESEIHFYHNTIKSSKTNLVQNILGFGDFIGNDFTIASGPLHLQNISNKSIKIQDNTIRFKSYVDSIFMFDDTTSVKDEDNSYDYEFLYNTIIASSYYNPFGGNIDSVCCNFEGNIFDKDISQYIIPTWSYDNVIKNVDGCYKSFVVRPPSNIPTSMCQVITVPYKRGMVKITTTNFNTQASELFNCETIFNVNPTSNNVSHYTKINEPIDLDSTNKNYLPIFAYEIIEDKLLIYTRSAITLAFRHILKIDCLFQDNYKSGQCNYDFVTTPSLDFSINIVSKCFTTDLELSSFINKYKGFEIIYNDKIIWWTGYKWVDATGVEV